MGDRWWVLAISASLFLSEAWFLPRMMFSVARQRVMMGGLVQELALRHTAIPSAQRLEELKHQKRGF